MQVKTGRVKFFLFRTSFPKKKMFREVLILEIGMKDASP